MPAVFDTPIVTNDLSIDRVLAVGLPVALVFLDGQPAPSLGEALERLARENAGQILIVKAYIQDSPGAARRYGVWRTPAVVDLSKGQVLAKAENISGADLARHVAFLLGKGPKPAPSAGEAGEPAARPRPESGRSAWTGSAAYGAPQPSQRASATQPGAPVEVTDQTFDQEVMRSSLPVLVDFWAPWCGPCRMTEPILKKLAAELGGRLKVAKVNVDENPFLSQRFDVRSIPTMLVVKNGKILDRWMGALPEPALRSRIAPLI